MKNRHEHSFDIVFEAGFPFIHKCSRFFFTYVHLFIYLFETIALQEYTALYNNMDYINITLLSFISFAKNLKNI